MPYHTEFPDTTLSAASRLTLKELLECPVFGSYVVSSFGNALQSMHKFDFDQEKDEFIIFKIQKIMNSIPYDVRKSCFEEVKQLNRERYEEKQDRKNWDTRYDRS